MFTATASHNKTIISPNYPSHSDSNLNCNWLLEVNSSLASDEYIVKVEFSDFEVACDDALKFYDGDSITESKLLRSYCGGTHPEVIYSTGRYLFVKFYTDNDYFTYRGFSFSFSAVKKGIVLSLKDYTLHGSSICWGTSYSSVRHISNLNFKVLSITDRRGSYLSQTLPSIYSDSP